MNVSPEIFKEIFLKEYYLIKDQFVSAWKCDKEYSNLFLGNNNLGGFVHKLAEKLNLNLYREYWSIDCVMFEHKDLRFFPSNSCYAKNLSLVLEHENNIKTSHAELNKLTIINSPLRVIVTYPFGAQDKYLEDYLRILKDADTYNDFSDKRKILIIFGEFKDEDLSWQFYKYYQDKFVKV